MSWSALDKANNRNEKENSSFDYSLEKPRVSFGQDCRFFFYFDNHNISKHKTHGKKLLYSHRVVRKINFLKCSYSECLSGFYIYFYLIVLLSYWCLNLHIGVQFLINFWFVFIIIYIFMSSWKIFFFFGGKILLSGILISLKDVIKIHARI